MDLRGVKMPCNIEFRRAIFENAYHFKGRYEVPLHNMGLTNIIGVNLDTTEASSNGAGKSQIEFCIRRLLYGRKVTRYETVGESINESNFLIGLEIYNHSKEMLFEIYEARKHRDYKKDGLYCFTTKNGERVPFGTKNSGEQLRTDFVKAALNMSYEEFVGTIMITQGSTHTLLNGSPQERVEFISNLFGLGVFDELYDKARHDLKNAEAKLLDFTEYGTEFNLLSEARSAVGDVTKKTEALDKAEAKLSKLKVERRRLRDEQSTFDREYSAYRAYKRSVKNLTSFVEENSDYDFSDVAEQISECEAKLDKVTGDLAKAESSARIRAQIDEAKRRLKNLKASIPKKFESTSAKEIKALLDKRRRTERELTDKLREMASKRDVIETINVNMQQLEQIDMLDADYDECKRLWSENETLETNAQAEIEKALARLEIKEDLDPSLSCCPTCGEKINASRVESTIAEIKASMLDWDKKRKKAHRVAQRCRLFCETKDLVNKHNLDGNVTTKVLEESALEIQNIRSKIESLELVYERVSERDALTSKLASYAESDLVDIDTDKLTARKSKLKRRLRTLREYCELKRAVPKAEVSNPQVRSTLDDELRVVDDSIEAVTSKIERYKSVVQNARELDRKLSDLKPKVDELKEVQQNVRILKGICLAYGKRGLKVRKIKEIIEAIKVRLPTWVGLMFTQRGFRIDTYGNETNLGFQVVQSYHDAKGKAKERRYDIRKLSGGERTRMMVALILTIIDIVPDNKKTNMLFLDEPEAGLDAVNRSLLAELLIPLLQKRKPSLFLIAHSLEVPRSNFSTEITVTRKNAQGSIQVNRLKKLKKEKA